MKSSDILPHAKAYGGIASVFVQLEQFLLLARIVMGARGNGKTNWIYEIFREEFLENDR